MPMLQRVLRHLDPKGRLRASLRRWWRPPAPPPKRSASAPRVTCIVLAGPDQQAAFEHCRSLAAQTWQSLEVLLLVHRRDVGRLPPLAGATPVTVADEVPLAVAANEAAATLAADLLLSAPGPARPTRVAELVAELMAAPHSAATRESPDGWQLRRRPTVPAGDAHRIDATTPVAHPADDRTFSLRFDAGPGCPADLPYRWRDVLADAGCRATADEPMTAARLALLSASRRPPGMSPRRAPTPRRIVLQADNFTEGGMEQVVIDLAEALRDSGFAPSLLILGQEGTAAQRARARGLTVDRMPADAAAYRRFLAEQRPQVVNAHYSTFGADACAELGIPFVQTMHNMYVWFGAEQVAEYRRADAHTHAYVCVSNNVARYADLAIGLPPDRMLVIPNGCNRDYLADESHRAAAVALRRELGLPAAARVFLNVASIQPPKAQHVLLGAFARVAAASPDAHLVVLGGAADQAYLDRQMRAARQAGLADRVHWVGRRADVSAFHQLACALVQPSFFEGWSLAITEAVLAGLPVIATDVGGAVEQLRDTDGILIAPAIEDLTGLHQGTLVPLLEAPCTELQERLAAAMSTLLQRGAGRSRLPAHWQSFLRDTAYRRCAEAFHWFADGGSPVSARAWLATEGTEVSA